jgi:hypothetical protein
MLILTSDGVGMIKFTTLSASAKPWATPKVPDRPRLPKPTYPNITPQLSLTPQTENRRSDYHRDTVIVALAHSLMLERPPCSWVFLRDHSI